MRAMHEGLHRASITSQHDTCATMQAVYSLSYTIPAPPCRGVSMLKTWVWRPAYWEVGRQASWRILADLGGGARGRRRWVYQLSRSWMSSLLGGTDSECVCVCVCVCVSPV